MDPTGGTRRRRLLRELGRGGAGTVHLAVAEGAGGFQKLKVVKFLHADLAARPGLLQAFLDEARLAAKLNHPNVVQTNEVGYDAEAERYFIEMEYLDGQSLEAIARDARVPEVLALFIVSEVCAGLHHAHELTGPHGEPLFFVHRDVSRHNVYVTYEGAVKLLDFGIAKAEGLTTDAGSGVKGKLTYMAPEQAAGRNVDRRADVFAVGVVLWQLLSGRRLWEGLAEGEILRRLARGEIEPLNDGPLGAICARALAPDPEARFPTAAAMQAAIDAHLAACGEHPSRKELAEYMEARFGEKRREVRAEIDARIAGAGDPEDGVEPSERASGDFTRTGEPTATTTSERREAVASPRKPRARRWAMGAAAFAALAIGAISIRQRATSAPLAPSAKCASNGACSAAGGAPSICRADGTCARLETDRCRAIADPAALADARTLWIGAMFPMSGPDADAFGKESVNAADLARQDFMRIAKGLPSREVDRPARPIGLVACDDAEDPLASARHLAEEVRVPAVVGFYSSQEVIDLAAEVFIPRGVVAMATQNRSALVTSIPHPPGSARYVWRTTTSMTASARPASAVIERILEPELAKKGQPLKVALFRAKNLSGLSISDAFLANLRFNGKSAGDNGAAYREFLFDEDASDYRPIADEIAAFAPHVVILPGVDGAVASTLLGPIEKRMGARAPRYVVGNYLFGADFFDFVAAEPGRRARFLGVNPPSSSTANRKLTVHYNEIFTPKVPQSASPGAVYDAMYVVLYGAYAAEGPTTGVALARAFARLVPPGAPIDVGPANMFDALTALGRGERIDLQGTATPLDFDLTTGDSPADFAVLCVGEREAVESNVTWNARIGALERLPLRCP